MTTLDWSTQQSRALYNFSGWGSGYFDINGQGHLEVKPNHQQANHAIDLYDLVKQINAQGVALPVLLRFTDILHHRLDTLNQAFSQAIEYYKYEGAYTAVYPIKVNQQFSVVNEISSHNSSAIGLEAGSKTELMAVLALAHAKSALIVCNGYKDRDYIRTALIGGQLGFKIYLVIEKQSELENIIREAKSLGVSPLLGVRIRLSAAGSGKWQNTGGTKSKFGLTAGQLIEFIQQLHKHDLTHTLQLLHFHLGSQITDLLDISKGMAECARYFVEMTQRNIPINTIDVGGGLGVDYEGTCSRNYFSKNYSVKEYANTIVNALHKACEQAGINPPNIVSESGRSITAHHAILVTNVIEVETPPCADTIKDEWQSDHPDLQQILTYLHEIDQHGNNPVETLSKASTLIDTINTQFSIGQVSLAEKDLAEKYFFKLSKLAKNKLEFNNQQHAEIPDELNEKLVHKYFCNFSLFQSLPDIWALNQTFPIVPLHKLDECPDQQGILLDITCDSDGRIDNYVSHTGVQSSLPLHKLSSKENYFLGIFLVGAYQEILGDMHNLFGDTNTVNVKITASGYELTNIQSGDTVDYVLKHIHYDMKELLGIYKVRIQQADITPQQKKSYFIELSNSLKAYTYPY